MNLSFRQYLPMAKSTLVLVLVLCTTRSWAGQTTVAELLKTAQHGKAHQRYTAIDDLGERRESAALVVPQLLKLLGDDDVQVQWRSVRALGNFGAVAHNAVPELSRLLAEGDPIIKIHTAAALGKIGNVPDTTIRALVALVTHQDSRVARVAIAALRNLKPDPKLTADALARALASSDEAVILHAVEALVEGGGKAVPLLKQALKQPQTAYLACVAIHEIGPDAQDTVPELTHLLGATSHSRVLIEALLTLGSIGPPAKSAAPAIMPLLEFENDVTVPVAAAYSLGAVGATDAEQPLRRASARDGNKFLQMMAAWSIAKLQPDSEQDVKLAVDRLTQGLKNKDATIRAVAAKGLQRLDAPPEVVAPALLQVANDPDPAVADNVVQALASLGDKIVPRACDALQKPKMCPLAVRVLTRLGPQAADAVQPLVDALSGTDAELRSDIHLALAAIGPGAAPATGALVNALASDDPRVRHTALRALRQIGPAAQAARKPLLDELHRTESVDAIVAAWALTRIASNDAKVAAALLPVLEKGLQHSDEEVRWESADALAELGPAATRAVPQLMILAEKDDRAEVRAAAQAALARISVPQ